LAQQWRDGGLALPVKTEPADLENQDCQTQAAWAAVHEARRGLSVAWISTFINALVIIVALFSPYIQGRFDREKERSDYYHSKSQLIQNMRDSLKSIKEFEKNDTLDGLETTLLRKSNYDTVGAEKNLQMLYQRLVQKQNQLTAMADKFSPDIQIRSAYSEIIELYDPIASRVSLIISEIGARELDGVGLVADNRKSMIDGINDEIKDVQFIIERNTFPNGQVRQGEIILPET
jgi:hypothetical protein